VINGKTILPLGWNKPCAKARISPEALTAWLAPRGRIMDAGCGNGRVTALLAQHAPKTSDVVGIDLTAAHVAHENLRAFPNVTTFEKDLLGDLSDLGQFDLIYCQEVLHHTSDPKKSFLNLVSLLAPQGEIAIYVYKKKAPMREYADDYIRDRIKDLSYQDAQHSMRQLTEFSKILTDLNVKVTVPDVDILEIKAGEYDVQRLLYHFFLKCFWNDEMNFDDNVAINYDWYHPQLCTRHTQPEIQGWFKDAGLTITHEHVDFYGITMHGKKA
jgi:SAM-dependent methyltransferase